MTIEEPRQINLKLGDLTIRGLVWGEGKPVLALHGWLDNAATFSRLAPLLKHCQVVAVDLPGHGLSDHRSKDARYIFLDWVCDVFAIADALGWEQFSLMGHSMGAAIASLAAGTIPERILRLVLLEGLGPLCETPQDAPFTLRTFIEEQKRSPRFKDTTYTKRETIVERVNAKLSDLSRLSIDLLLDRSLKLVPGGYAWRADIRVRRPSPLRLNEQQVLAFLKEIKAATLLYRAEQGYPFDLEVMQGRVDAVEKIEIKVSEGGHHCHLEKADAMADDVDLFLSYSDERDCARS
jgi:pimeloyl-ACP methyl ester carboxylesterase